MEEPSEEPIREEEAPEPLGLGTIGPVRAELGAAFSARSRMAVRGLNVHKDKEKVSLTLDRDLIEAIREAVAPKQLSATVNELLHRAVEQVRLRMLVEELESEKGPASQVTYQHLLDEWFDDARK